MVKYASPSWCWAKVTKADIGMPSENTSREDWLQWAKAEGMTVMLFPTGSDDFVLVQSTKDCFLPSSASLDGYEFRSILV